MVITNSILFLHFGVKNLYIYKIIKFNNKSKKKLGSWIIADLILPNDYPSSPPMVTFRNDFKHINIWEGTYKLCMYYINPSYYTS